MAVSNVWKIVQLWLDQQRFPPNQSKLAEAVGVARSAVSDWKVGKTRPSPEHVKRLSDLMSPTLGPNTHGMLIVAVARDLGYDMPDTDAADITALRIAGRKRPDGYEVITYQRDVEVSEVSGTVGDLVAADEQEQSISGEQEESETP